MAKAQGKHREFSLNQSVATLFYVIKSPRLEKCSHNIFHSAPGKSDHTRVRKRLLFCDK